MISWNSDFLHISLNYFKHVYSPGARTDKPFSVVSAYYIRDYQRICFIARNSSTCVLKVFRKRAEWVGGGGLGVVAYEYISRIN